MLAYLVQSLSTITSVVLSLNQEFSMSVKLTKSMSKNTYSGHDFNVVNLFVFLMQGAAQQLIAFIREKMSTPCWRHTEQTNTLCHTQNGEAALECMMQMNSVYQAQDVEAIFGEKYRR